MQHNRTSTEQLNYRNVLFCSLAVLDPRVPYGKNIYVPYMNKTNKYMSYMFSYMPNLYAYM